MPSTLQSTFSSGQRWAKVWPWVLGLCLTGCATPQGSDPAPAEPNVVATSTIIASLTAEVGGDDIQLTSLLRPGADPHVYEPVPQDSRALEQADLILYNGYNLEPGLIKLMKASGTQARQLAVGEVVTPLDLEKEGQKVPDPHVWGDVSNAIAMTEAIRDALIEISPEDGDRFRQNADRLIQELRQLDAWVGDRIATIPPQNRQLITTHDAFQYYANAYGLTIAGTLIGISTEEQPSAQTVQRLVQAIQQTGVPAIFAETTINPQLITTVAEEAKVQLADPPLYSDSVGAPGTPGDSYLKMIVSNTRSIVKALGGQDAPFPASPTN